MQSVTKPRHRDLVPGQFLYCCDDHDHDAVSIYFLKQAFYILTHCCGFMIFGHQCSTSQHHAVYWELKSKCFSSRYLSGREEELRSPRAFLSTVIVPAQGNRYKACRSPDLGRLFFLSHRACFRIVSLLLPTALKASVLV